MHLLQQENISLIEIINYRAQYQPDKKAYIFLQNGEEESASLTYGELDRRARAIASRLQSWRGERALLLYPSGLEFITAFFGCLYAGVVAMPVYPPKRNQKLSRLLSIVNDAQANLALTTSSILLDISQKWKEETESLTHLNWVPTDTIEADSQDFVPTLVTPESLAFLQYTSGSTGTPKGVMVTHGNLIHNSECIKQAFELTSDSVSVSWLPTFHDMGLIDGVLQPLYTGFTGYLMPPVAFLMKPACWLQAITRYKATHCGGPNFAYDLCVSKVTSEQLKTLDLSSWYTAYSGSEPVRNETLNLFVEKFRDCGFKENFFYPCYGMAEATLFISGGFKQSPPIVKCLQAQTLKENIIVDVTHPTPSSQEASKVLVGCGHSWLDYKIVIADPDSFELCADGRVGEIWVSSASVAKGYWNRPQQTQETFEAYLKDGLGPFLRTGDLGFLHDGELYVTGRLKDIIIIRGQNHYPQDIELTVQKSYPALRLNCGAAFTIEVKGKEQLIIVQEVERTYLRKLDVNHVLEIITQAVATEHGLQVYATVLVKTGSIPKTSSGKIQRHACRTKFLNASLDVVEDWSENPQYKSGFIRLQDEVESVFNTFAKKRE
ncbi:acyl-CoA synthetase (AMP-forming)/AMP-acid ligase II [Cylindrospermum stagnale PCC 7417]|uniref:Acyl-CoA synthetase (AMP-forming)/AMP-acid ligase II n=1 Tax=Cylindrospermum stagnale PCC 7417 TaxID=56107 RepID=K9WVC4_9NOST|nr:fatty acyl-AMP ligase [Cylindrospermum stagnale]AFZ24148.1 acyl-CoA synthetase (AMP-forming)/AMP-acid ligase II [Cylindrospermum stagnale PCC 7417]